ncbi:MAG TPA: serine/threonine-protein kinase [Polyangia bacterium]|jgi:serine/threonine-protein kinase|nr:serine/threonine-protein kinase [Polyangia bacterium]
MVGQSIGNYRITKLLGEGGMGMVYLAEHPGLGRRVAVKVLHPDLARSDEMVQRLFNEARAANAVGHRGIVEVSDFGVLPSGAPYIVMEYLVGESLAVRMTAAGRLPLGAAVEIAGQAAGALGAAHAQGIVHRDLKPDNFFLIRDPHLPGRELLKILDFGIAKLTQRPFSTGEVRTRTGAVLGTPRYMSPEQCRDSRDVDHRSDIYSLGVILYEMLAGEPPFVSNSWGEMAHLHIGVSPPGLRSRIAEIPENVEQIVHKALEKNPAARFQSMTELEEALTGLKVPRTLALPEPPATAATAAEAAEVGSTRRLQPSAPARTLRRTTLAGAAAEVEGGQRRSRYRRPLAAALLIGSLVTGLALRGLLSRARERTTAPALAPSKPLATRPAAPPVRRAPAAPAPPIEETTEQAQDEPDTIAIEIVTNPGGARIIRERDGEIIGSTPLRLPWPRADGDEVLRVERDGYRSEQVIAPRDRDLSLSLNLKKIARPPAHSTTPTAAPPSPQTATPTPPSRRRPSEKRDTPSVIAKPLEPLKI